MQFESDAILILTQSLMQSAKIQWMQNFKKKSIDLISYTVIMIFLVIQKNPFALNAIFVDVRKVWNRFTSTKSSSASWSILDVLKAESWIFAQKQQTAIVRLQRMRKDNHGAMLSRSFMETLCKKEKLIKFILIIKSMWKWKELSEINQRKFQHLIYKKITWNSAANWSK